MRIEYNDSIHIQVTKKELKDMQRWFGEQGLVYHSIKKNPVKSAIGEFYIQLIDFLSRGEDE